MVHGCHDKILMKEESEKKKKLNGKNLTTIRCTQTTATHIHHQIVVHKRKTSNSKNIRSFTNTHTNQLRILQKCNAVEPLAADKWCKYYVYHLNTILRSNAHKTKSNETDRVERERERKKNSTRCSHLNYIQSFTSISYSIRCLFLMAFIRSFVRSLIYEITFDGIWQRWNRL